jgi:hypothetical protein
MMTCSLLGGALGIKGKSSYQQIAVLGMVVMMRGRQPLMKPPHPNSFLMIAAALTIPRTFRISACWLSPRVCNSVFITSRGVVMPAAKAPAKPPAMQ